MAKSSAEVSLNDEQARVVSHEDGPLMVVAGAGTGKTRVITERIVSLIEGGVKPEAILALTFTEKAAGEMLDRVNAARGGYTLDVTIATYNGFGDELIKQYVQEIGLGNMRLLGETGQLVFLRQHFDKLGLDYFAPVSRPDSQIETIAGYISRLKQQLVQPEAYLKFAEKLPTSNDEERLEKAKHTELAQIYKAYQSLCREHHVMDYDDQLFLAVELLQKRPNILKQLQRRFQYILVDEFQDTNPMQSALLDLLASEHKNIMVVGDDDQSIYGWRGATLSNILSFKQRYSQAKEITLIENYRSTQNILDSAYLLIQNNNPHRLEAMNNLDKRLRSNTEVGALPQALRFSTLDAELSWIAYDIKRRLKGGQDPSSIAVLARRNQGVQKIHEMLDIHDIHHAVAGLSQDLYSQTAIKHLLEALKAVNDPADDAALYHTLGGPIFNASPHILAELASQSRRSYASLAAIIDASEYSELKKHLETILTWRETIHTHSVGALAYAIISDSGWKQTLYHRADSDPETALQVQALGQFFKTLKEFERISETGSVSQYIDNLNTLRSAGSELHDASLDISDTLLNVMSIHRAKGLEWDTVYIVDCTEGSFPMRSFGTPLAVPKELLKVSAADDHMAEERRLMYVAATRARKELILTYADTHTGNTKRRPSRFLSELLPADRPDDIIMDGRQQISMELFAPHFQIETLPLPKDFKNFDSLILSVSQIDTWLRCPQDFYYLYVLGIPSQPDPMLTHGIIIHSCVQKINEGLRDGNMPTLANLLTEAESKLPRVGYMSKKSRERAHQKLIESIKHIYKTLSVAAKPLHIEYPFRVGIPNANLIMTGRMDAVFETEKGIEIRDYKSGDSVTSADKAKQRAVSSQQLALYALAWQLLHGNMPSVLTLDFIETGFIGSVKKQAKTLESLNTKLVEMTENLANHQYPRGRDHIICSHPH